MMRDSAVFRHTVQDVAIRNGCAAHPGGGTAAEGADIPPLGTAQAQTGPKREKWARLGLIRDAPLVPLSCLVFPFRGGSLGPPLSPVSSVPGFAFRGSGGPPVVWLGFAPRDLAPGSSES